MQTISLTQENMAIVDDANFAELNKYKWRTLETAQGVYAARKITINHKEITVLMHREIMGLKYGDKRQVDHINHNPLDNRKCNLRICTHAENGRNRKIQTGTTSKYKGVSWHKPNKKWRAAIGYNHKLFHLGNFDNEIDAAKAYDKKAKELHGKFAQTNF